MRKESTIKRLCDKARAWEIVRDIVVEEEDRKYADGAAMAFTAAKELLSKQEPEDCKTD